MDNEGMENLTIGDESTPDKRLDPKHIDWHRKPSLRRSGSGRKKAIDENRRASATPRSLQSNSHRQLGQLGSIIIENFFVEKVENLFFAIISLLFSSILSLF